MIYRIYKKKNWGGCFKCHWKVSQKDTEKASCSLTAGLVSFKCRQPKFNCWTNVEARLSAWFTVKCPALPRTREQLWSLLITISCRAWTACRHISHLHPSRKWPGQQGWWGQEARGPFLTTCSLICPLEIHPLIQVRFMVSTLFVLFSHLST